MNDRWKILLIFSGIAFFLLAFHVFASWYSVQETGDLTLLMVSPLLYFLPVIGSALYLPFLIVMAFFKKTREDSITGILVCLVLLLGFFSQNTIGNTIRNHAFEKLVIRTEEVLIAIELYKLEKGRYPLTLEHLKPRYIFEVPKTKMGAYPEYTYFVGDEASNSYPGNPYILMVETPSGFINFDKFLYLPKQNYSEIIVKHSFTKIGKWVYYTD